MNTAADDASSTVDGAELPSRERPLALSDLGYPMLPCIAAILADPVTSSAAKIDCLRTVQQVLLNLLSSGGTVTSDKYRVVRLKTFNGTSTLAQDVDVTVSLATDISAADHNGGDHRCKNPLVPVQCIAAAISSLEAAGFVRSVIDGATLLVLEQPDEERLLAVSACITSALLQLTGL